MNIPDQPAVEYANVSIRLGGRPVLSNLTFSVVPGEIFTIIGYSGTGKSVTLQTMTGLLIPDGGSIKVFGQQLVGMDDAELEDVRRRFGYLFQSGALINWMTVRENVDLPLREHTAHSRMARHRIVMEKLKLVSMEKDGDKYPSEISGGMKKRAALARAIVLDPQVVLFDEPTSGLDPVIANQIDELIMSINRELRVTCIVVTHDLESAFRMSDRIAFFWSGKMHYVGTPREFSLCEDGEVLRFVSAGRSGENARETLKRLAAMWEGKRRGIKAVPSEPEGLVR